MGRGTGPSAARIPGGSPRWAEKGRCEMYEVDGIVYAGSPREGLTVKAVRVLDTGMLVVTFSSGEERLVDTQEVAGWGPALAPVGEEAVWRGTKVAGGTLTWLDGTIDIAPEYLYAHSYPYETPPWLRHAAP